MALHHSCCGDFGLQTLIVHFSNQDGYHVLYHWCSPQVVPFLTKASDPPSASRAIHQEISDRKVIFPFPDVATKVVICVCFNPLGGGWGPLPCMVLPISSPPGNYGPAVMSAESQ